MSAYHQARFTRPARPARTFRARDTRDAACPSASTGAAGPDHRPPPADSPRAYHLLWRRGAASRPAAAHPAAPDGGAEDTDDDASAIGPLADCVLVRDPALARASASESDEEAPELGGPRRAQPLGDAATGAGPALDGPAPAPDVRAGPRGVAVPERGCALRPDVVLAPFRWQAGVAVAARFLNDTPAAGAAAVPAAEASAPIAVYAAGESSPTPSPRPTALPPPSQFSVAATVVPGAPSLLPDTALTAAGFKILLEAGGAHLLAPCGRVYHVPRAPAAGDRLVLRGQAIQDASGGTYFGIGHLPGAGRLIELIIDSGAELLVLDPADAHVLAARTGRPGRPVAGIGGIVPSADAGHMEVRCADVATWSPAWGDLEHVLRSPSLAPTPRAAAGPGRALLAACIDSAWGYIATKSPPAEPPPTPSDAGAGGAALAAVAAPAPSRTPRGPRPSRGPQLRTADEVADRLLVWNPAHLGEYPDCVDGVRHFAPPKDTGATRSDLFFKAAASRPRFHARRSAPSTAELEHYAPGELWWLDGSRRYSQDVDGNRQIISMFEARTGCPFFWVDRDKSAESLVRALEAHELHMRTLLPGVTVKRYSADYDSAWGRQGDAGYTLTEKVRAYLSSRPSLTFVPMPPHSPNANFAENHMGLVNALAFACALRGNLNMATVSIDMLRGAGYLFAMRLLPPPAPGMPRQTRYTALTGRKWDVSRFPGRPGQACWIYDEESGGVGHPRVLSSYLVCPDWTVSGCWVRLLGSLRYRLVRTAYVLDDASARSVMLDGSALAQFRGTLVDPAAAEIHERLSTLLADYRGVPPETLHLVTYSADPRTGLPTSVTRHYPVRGVDGELILVPESACDGAAAKPAPPGGDAVNAPGFSAVPVGPNHKLSPEIKSWFLALPPSCPLLVRPDPGRQPYRGDGTPNASYFRRLPYADARTVGDLGPLRGLRRDDVLFDLARGAILVPSGKLPGGVFAATLRPGPSVTPSPPHPEAATQEEIRRLASLEDPNRDPDPHDVETACLDLRHEGLTPVRAIAVSLLRDALDEEGATRLAPEDLGGDDMEHRLPPVRPAAPRRGVRAPRFGAESVRSPRSSAPERSSGDVPPGL
jgi:hypothetical protein